ncbi:hypothetical protein MHU86_16051 [Fragilaria crotonensis]|nr:hypothetical protein MHU86_16051 [Fragilaria crotonensis]
MQEAVESMAAELSLQDGCFASSSNLVPKMFDQPLTAAIRTGQWENQHTVLNPDGIKTNFGLHHLAPPRTNSATYITRQQAELRSRFTLAVLAANAGHYKDVSAIFKLFQPEPSKEELNRRKREATNEANGNATARNRPFSSSGNRPTGSPNQHASTVTPNGSPASGPIPNLPGKTVFVHASPAPQKLPHPGAIFLTRPEKTSLPSSVAEALMMVALARYQLAPLPFSKTIESSPRDLKTKLKEWVTNHNLVTWHADVVNWANPPGNVSSTRSTSSASNQ